LIHIRITFNISKAILLNLDVFVISVLLGAVSKVYSKMNFLHLLISLLSWVSERNAMYGMRNILSMGSCTLITLPHSMVRVTNRS